MRYVTRWKRRRGFFLTELIMALGLLGLVALFIYRFEHLASLTTRSLERQYAAQAAAESQFERLKAGLDVLDRDAFRREYPGLDLEFRVEKPEGKDAASGVAIVKSRDGEGKILVRLTGPVPGGKGDFGGKRP